MNIQIQSSSITQCGNKAFLTPEVKFTISSLTPLVGINFSLTLPTPEATIKFFSRTADTSSFLGLAVASAQEERVGEPQTPRFQFSNEERR